MSVDLTDPKQRLATIRHAAELMAASAITAPKSGGQLFLAGKPSFMEAVFVDGMLFIGLLPGWYPPNYDCGACGYATCAEFLHATKPLRDDSTNLEFAGPVCNLRDIDLGIAVGSAAKTAAVHSIDCRCQTRAAVAARKLGFIRADHAVALSLSISHKAIGFDRGMPDVEFDTVAHQSTGTLPVAAASGDRIDRARHRQQPRYPITS